MSIITATSGWYVMAVAYEQHPTSSEWELLAHLGVFYPVAAWKGNEEGIAACFAKDGKMRVAVGGMSTEKDEFDLSALGRAGTIDVKWEIVHQFQLPLDLTVDLDSTTEKMPIFFKTE